jgi:RNA polymerase sigma factor (sigma-70 family)
MESLQGGRKADAIRLRYLLELPVEEVAETLGMSVDTVQRDIRFALAWLADRLKASRE